MDKEIESLISEKIRDIPTLPVVAVQILNVTDDPKSSVEDLEKVIIMDQVVSMRLLKAVNSAFFGFPRKIGTISQAIVILGYNNVRSLALSVSILGALSGKGSLSAMNPTGLWQHAAGTGFVARALGKIAARQEAELIFLAGLLHDIGFIPLDRAMPKELKNVIRMAHKEKIPIYKAEKQVLGFTHADVGCFIAEKWLLPSTLKEPIACHHAPPAALEHPLMTYAVHAADIICKVEHFGDYGDNDYVRIEDVDQQAKQIFNITNDISPEARAFLEKDIGKANDFLSIFSG